jgi:hypothetical protein
MLYVRNTSELTLTLVGICQKRFLLTNWYAFPQNASPVFRSIQVLFISAAILTMLGAVLGLVVPSLRRLD